MKVNKLALSLIGLSVIATALLYPGLPEIIPHHWNIDGTADRFGSKSGVFITALLPLGIYLLLWLIPKFDPRKEAYQMHAKAYRLTTLALVLFLIILHWATLLIAKGININVGIMVRALIGILFILLGNYLSQVRPNYFFGIRTPWTLADNNVWRKTHRLGGYSFVGAGALALLSLLFKGGLAFVLFVGAIIGSGLLPMVYSYIEYKRLK
ncbi:MAG TPA: SdpI family protein [Bacillota bacterium]|nr:SdpI family protein [Bacillota bacterium]